MVASVLIVLQKECLYANLKSCDFCMEKLYFLDMLLMQKVLRWMRENVRVI
jgi:hypothetical protein